MIKISSVMHLALSPRKNSEQTTEAYTTPASE